MAANHRVYDSCHLQAHCQEPESASEPYARQSSMGYLFYLLQKLLQLQKSLSLAVSGLNHPAWRARNYMNKGGLSTGAPTYTVD